MAGFDSSRTGNYYVPRTKAVPPQSLLSLLWPWLDEWRHWFSAGGGHAVSASYEHIQLDDGDEDRLDLAAQGFLALLAELRTAFLQDSVFLRKEYPHHPIWRHPVFGREEYHTFALEVELAARDEEEPFEVRIRNVVPDVVVALDHARKQTLQAIEVWGSRTTRDVKEIARRLDDFCHRTLTATTVVRLAGAAAAEPEPEPAAAQASMAPSYEIDQAVAAQASTAPSYEIDQAVPAPQLPYEMDRTIQAVPTLWREWTEGLRGRPAVETLERKYGSRWRTTQKNKTFFFRRKLIIDEIRRRAAAAAANAGQAQTEAEAIEQLEAIRQEKGFTLNKLGIWITERQRDRT